MKDQRRANAAKGNLAFGTASLAYYNGSSLAVNEDVVVVVINYRTNSKSTNHQVCTPGFYPLTDTDCSLRLLKLTGYPLRSAKQRSARPAFRSAMDTIQHRQIRRRSGQGHHIRRECWRRVCQAIARPTAFPKTFSRRHHGIPKHTLDR